ncbi:MAG: hypothetical protein HY720_17625 [Planctomycetes bacterium]|nr:hypothetical protein [Planctomycetota bacterium]
MADRDAETAELLKRLDEIEEKNRRLRRALNLHTYLLVLWPLLLLGGSTFALSAKVREKEAAGEGTEAIQAATVKTDRIWLGTNEAGETELVLSGRATAGVAARTSSGGPGEVEAGRFVFTDKFGHGRSVLRLDDGGNLLVDRLDADGKTVRSKPLDE